MDRIQAAIQRARVIISARLGRCAACRYPYIMYGYNSSGDYSAYGIAAHQDHQAAVVARVVAADRNFQLEELVKNSSGAVIPA